MILWIDFNGSKILFSDYKGLDPDEMINQLKEETEILLKQDSPVLYMADFSNVIISPNFMKIVSEDGKKN